MNLRHEKRITDSNTDNLNKKVMDLEHNEKILLLDMTKMIH